MPKGLFSHIEKVYFGAFGFAIINNVILRVL